MQKTISKLDMSLFHRGVRWSKKKYYANLLGLGQKWGRKLAHQDIFHIFTQKWVNFTFLMEIIAYKYNKKELLGGLG